MRATAVIVAISLLSFATAAYGQEAGRPDPAADTDDNGTFTLGQIIVTGTRPRGVEVGVDTIGQEAIYTFNRQTLDEAASLIPGVSAANTGGSRNERLIFVRGFDRFQVPLSIDGIRVYLPADNRLDYGRFLTPDIAEIQVAKGYASVLDGPGAMGGAINLVTRRPTQSLEVEARGVLDLDRGLDYAGYTAFGLAGTRQDRFYAQASFARTFRDHWDLPGGFVATANEDGGARDFSRTEDWRLNVKAGFTPNTTDEYAISYTRQEGSKNAPLHVTDDIVPPLVPGTPLARFWSWPYWNLDSLYFLSTTALGNAATLKTRIYLNTFNNLLRSFDNRSQTTQTLGRAFNSYYEDEAYGASAELAVALTPANTFTLATYYRRDEHVEYQQGFPSGLTEPRQTNIEDTWSIAAENRLALSPTLTVTAGASGDWRDLKRAEEFGTPPGGGAARLFSYPIRNASAVNGQGRIEWTPDATSRIYAAVSSRARFPTIFERFSTQFGTAASNPGLAPERATNYEIGAARTFGILRVEAAAFYSDINDAIVSIRPITAPSGVSRRENLGDAEYHGGEVSAALTVSRTLTLGGNYTYIHRSFAIEPSSGAIPPLAFELTDVPTHKAFVYADWSPVERLRISPSLDIAGDRNVLASTTPTPPGVPLYYDTGAYVNAALRIDYAVIDGVALGIGARNLFDETYTLADGFPEQGRSFYASLRARY